ncbi:hypothetical protein TVAG_276150 [Trichomonas vaginalis G3]|uniref:Tetraspanin family protein n=1 Tax=Trichomonas vaginalis (strain ATCC PRA-98 / G3) TaxID=412133 RepID=A2ECP6_TRIV3|nr:tetraspanin family [Trichomonas vaginalis G3]EAY09542.1 hypothetical protein TVAG_276150 [Trichomonas vaginalis G3]KAI5533169.1 tetraspanin family [Trichomonas vaginalis G3]|eukprot:XP_001321765.1 hypothetical protein [Trichomonas vaginalis G3]
MNHRTKALSLAVCLNLVASFWAIIAFFAAQRIIAANGISGISSFYEGSLSYCTIIYIGSVIIITVFLFVKRLWSLIISGIFTILITIFCIILFSLYLSKKEEIVESYHYVFENPDYLKFGLKIQNNFSCCGWENATDVPDELSCTGNYSCKPAITKVINRVTLSLDSGLFIGFAFFVAALYFVYKVFMEVLHPISSFDELTLAPLDHRP